MKRITKRISAVFLALVLTLTMVPAAVQAASELSVPSSVTRYQSSANGSSSYVSFSVSGLTSKQSIAKSSVKSSNTKVAAPDSVSLDSWNYKTEYFAKGRKPYEHSSRYASLSFISQKTGTSTISYKIGSKTYKTKINILKYTNPVKKLVVTGVGSSNLAGKFKTQNYASAKVAGSKSLNQVKVTAASGWKITSVGLYNNKTSVSYSVGSYSKPTSTMTLYTAALKKGVEYSVSVSLENIKTGGTLSVSLNLN